MMRPDEQANQAEIIRDQRMRKGVSAGIGLASGALGARVLPFLNEYVPSDLAMKGLQKVAPKIADFLKRGQAAGLNIKEGIEYVKDNLTPKEEAKQDKRNLVEMHSPELHQFITQHIQAGKSHKQAGALAKLPRKEGDFNKVIDKLMKENNATWEDILESVYGGQQAAQQSQQPTVQAPDQQQPGQPHPNSALGQQAARKAQQQQSQSQQQGQPQGQSQGLDPMVEQILQQGQLILKARKGQ